MCCCRRPTGTAVAPVSSDLQNVYPTGPTVVVLPTGDQTRNLSRLNNTLQVQILLVIQLFFFIGSVDGGAAVAHGQQATAPIVSSAPPLYPEKVTY